MQRFLTILLLPLFLFLSACDSGGDNAPKEAGVYEGVGTYTIFRINDSDGPKEIDVTLSLTVKVDGNKAIITGTETLKEGGQRSIPSVTGTLATGLVTVPRGGWSLDNVPHECGKMEARSAGTTFGFFPPRMTVVTGFNSAESRDEALCSSISFSATNLIKE